MGKHLEGCEQKVEAMTRKLDITALENIVDIAMMRFNIRQEDRKELTSLFMAYTGEFFRQTCYPVIGTDVYKVRKSKCGLVQDCRCEPEKKEK